MPKLKGSIFGGFEMVIDDDDQKNRYREEIEYLRRKYAGENVCNYLPQIDSYDQPNGAIILIAELQKAMFRVLQNNLDTDEGDFSAATLEDAEEQLNKKCGKNNLCLEAGYAQGYDTGYVCGDSHGYYRGVRESEKNLLYIAQSEHYYPKALLNKISIIMINITDKKINELEPDEKKAVKQFLSQQSKRFK